MSMEVKKTAQGLSVYSAPCLSKCSACSPVGLEQRLKQHSRNVWQCECGLLLQRYVLCRMYEGRIAL